MICYWARLASALGPSSLAVVCGGLLALRTSTYRTVPYHEVCDTRGGLPQQGPRP